MLIYLVFFMRTRIKSSFGVTMTIVAALLAIPLSIFVVTLHASTPTVAPSIPIDQQIIEVQQQDQATRLFTFHYENGDPQTFPITGSTTITANPSWGRLVGFSVCSGGPFNDVSTASEGDTLIFNGQPLCQSNTQQSLFQHCAVRAVGPDPMGLRIRCAVGKWYIIIAIEWT
jgi:hypothetical protein